MRQKNSEIPWRWRMQGSNKSMVWESDYGWLRWLTVHLLSPPFSPASCSYWLRGCMQNWTRKAVRAHFFAGLFLTWRSCLIKPSIQPHEAVVLAPLNWVLWGWKRAVQGKEGWWELLQLTLLPKGVSVILPPKCSTAEKCCLESAGAWTPLFTI